MYKSQSITDRPVPPSQHQQPALAELMHGDPEELLHKATGWMLREVGKRDQSVLEAFLDEYAAVMPRTALRYAIERLPEDERLAWLRRR